MRSSQKYWTRDWRECGCERGYLLKSFVLFTPLGFSVIAGSMMLFLVMITGWAAYRAVHKYRRAEEWSAAKDGGGMLLAVGGSERESTLAAFSVTKAVSDDASPQREADFSHIRALLCGESKVDCEQQKAVLKRLQVKCDIIDQCDLVVRRIRSRSEGLYAYRLCILEESTVNANPTLPDEIMALPEPRPLIFLSVQTGSEKYRRWENKVAGILPKPFCESGLFNAMLEAFGEYVPKDLDTAVLPVCSGKRAMIVEDNPMNANILGRLLNKASLTVTICENGKIALEEFLSHPADTYQIIFMDVQMPVMNGYEATREIRQVTAKKGHLIPICAVSANAFPKDIEMSKNAGMNEHLSKPIQVGKLFALLNRYCPGAKRV